MDTEPSFGALIRRRRRELSYTMEELALRVGYSSASIRKVEAGLRRPSRQVAELLAEALQIPPEERAAFLRLARLSPGERSHAQTSAQSTAQALRLPTFLTHLIGREAQIREVRERLLGEDVRLLTLTGPGGIGKTRLAVEAAAGLAEEFPDGIMYVPLTTVADPGLVAGTIAQTLGLKESGTQPAEEIARAYLRDKRLLLVLDNFEQIVGAAALLVDLLGAAPGVKMLVTSREALSLRAEHQYPVPALELPEAAAGVEALRQNPAVALFAERAEMAGDFTLTDENAPTVAAICRRLDGLPLAIELAAARSRLLTPGAMLARFDGSDPAARGPLQLLTTGARDVPARHITLRDTIGWSYDLLDPDDKTSFARFAVFTGGGMLEAAETVLGGGPGGEDDPDTLESLGSLVDKSLLRQETAEGGEVRVSMLQMIQEYALERLRESGEEAAVRARHATCYVAMAEEAEPKLNGPEQQAWNARLERDHDNLRAALAWAQEVGDWETAERLAGAIWRFWARHGHLSEGRRRLESLLDAVTREGPQLEGAEIARRAKVFHGAGACAYEQGDHATAREKFEMSAQLRRKIGDRAGLGASLTNLGSVAIYAGDYDRAAALYKEAYESFREMGDKWGTAMVVGNAGWVELCRRDYDAAMRLYEESLQIHREAGNTWGMAKAMGSMGWAALYGGKYERAQELAEESLALARELGDTDTESDMLDILGRAALEQGDPGRAVALLGQSIELSRRLGDNAGMAICLLAYASVAGRRGDIEGATRAATLYGAIDTLKEYTADFQRAYFERQIEAVRGILDEASWQAAQERGNAMTLDEAIQFAQEESLD